MKRHASIVSGIAAVSQFASLPLSTAIARQQAPAATTRAMEYSGSSSLDNTTFADAGWENIPFKELTVCETIGGGGVALVHRGFYRRKAVALKILVSFCSSPLSSR